MMEQYVVKFWTLNKEGYTAQLEVTYSAKGKKAHKKVDKRWRKDYPKGSLVSITFQ